MTPAESTSYLTIHGRGAPGCLVVLLLGGCAMSFELPDGGRDTAGLDGGRFDVSTPDGGIDTDALDGAPFDVTVPDTGSPDASLLDAPPRDAGPPCVIEADCDSSGWCVDRVRCDPSAPEADERGCVHLGPPPACDPGYVCDSDRRGCWCPDVDRDGVLSVLCGGRDCDDADPSVPRIGDGCDGRDSDCDGSVDENPNITLFPDADRDGYAPNSAGAPMIACSAEGYASMLGDCDDAEATVHPDAPQICNGRDDACEGSDFVPEDYDGDGFAARGADCLDVAGSLPRLDCIEYSRQIAPGQPERCNTLDDDCDPSTPDGSAAVNGCLPGHPCIAGGCRQTVSLVARADMTCALLVDGTTRCWGANAGCEDFDVSSCYWPTDTVGWRDVVTMEPEGYYAVDASGVILAYPGMPPPTLPPTRVLGPLGFCVGRADTGGLWCSDVGDMPGPNDVVQVEWNCVRTRAGEVWCWGPNATGEVGDGTTIDRALPVRVIAADVVDMAMSGSSRCAVLNDGSVRCWGRGVLSPEVRADLVGLTEIHGGSYYWGLRGASDAVSWVGRELRTFPGTGGLHGLVAGYSHACAVTAEGGVVCFGEGVAQLSLPYGTSITPPVTVGGL